jgi:hypothetical protein
MRDLRHFKVEASSLLGSLIRSRSRRREEKI